MKEPTIEETCLLRESEIHSQDERRVESGYLLRQLSSVSQAELNRRYLSAKHQRAKMLSLTQQLPRCVSVTVSAVLRTTSLSLGHVVLSI